jgi:hypothetical protein
MLAAFNDSEPVTADGDTIFKKLVPGAVAPRPYNYCKCGALFTRRPRRRFSLDGGKFYYG